ncbi:MAG: NADH-quinone oxidoreductase subunit L [Pseudomonadota bacterium]
METIYLWIALAPLLGSIVAGLFGRSIGRVGAQSVTIAGVAVSFALALVVFKAHVLDGAAAFNGTVYTWLASDLFTFNVGFLIDNLTAVMMVVVTGVSLMVHIYTIGYMAHDEELWPETSRARNGGYQRFFSYISLFTFSMLMLVMSNNFMQLFFGWEAVGLVSYLLIGFYMNRETAIYANLKAFIVNRVGDFGFLLGIAAVWMYAGTLDYHAVFAKLPELAPITVELIPGVEWALISVICILLFIGAMGKSAQIPLHVWLPDSMEGPTPISALIHAATMVTAGIFMVARMSPMYELSEAALSFIMIIGAITAFSMGLLGIVANDIKRVVAFSTLSQLGYMTVALGVSAYSAALFHLMTHAFFKALLFLAAGSVIIAMHHEQDIRKMGGLRKYMPITFWTSMIGALALIGFPGFSGFFSKDAIIEAVHLSALPGAGFAYWLVLLGVFVTAFYTFRMIFLVFFGKERMDHHTREHLHESPWVVTVPLVILAIPAVMIGWVAIDPMLFGDLFKGIITVTPAHDVLAQLGSHFHGAWSFVLHGLTGPAVWLAAAGVLLAWATTLKFPIVAQQAEKNFAWLNRLLKNGFGFDDFNKAVFEKGSLLLGRGLWKWSDLKLIDGLMVNGTAQSVGYVARVSRLMQTGFMYHYAFVMIFSVLAIMTWVLFF